MGVKIFDIKDIINYSKKYISQNLNELNLLELGEQEFKIFNEEFKDTLIKNFLDKNPRKWPKKSPKGRIGVYSKDFLESIFNKVVSIDNVISCKRSIQVNLINNLNTLNINKNNFINIKSFAIHRIQAISDLTLYEVSTPHLDDVIRILDDKNRKNGKIKTEHKLNLK